MGLRILQILNRVPWPLKDGGNLAHYNLLKGLSEAGCEMTVAAMNTTRHPVDVSLLPASFTGICKLYTCKVDNRIRPLRAFLNLFSNRSYHIERFESEAFRQLLTTILSDQEFDLIIFDNLFTAPYVEHVKGLTKAKVILRQHNVEHRIWETMAAQTSQPLKKAYLELLARRLRKFEQEHLNRFDAVIALTESDRKIMTELGCRMPMLVLPVGIEFPPVHTVVDPEPFSVFHLGAMDWLPNQDAMKWFIEQVWPLVVAKVPQAKLYVAGKNMPAAFMKYASVNITITGEVENAVEFMKSKLVMVVPLFAGSGIRVKILEGMSAGKAIVSTSLGAGGIVYEHGKNILIADDETAFAGEVISLLTNEKLCVSIANEAASLATDIYHNNKVISRLLNFCKTHLLN